jgi:hypothetical protein
MDLLSFVDSGGIEGILTGLAILAINLLNFYLSHNIRREMRKNEQKSCYQVEELKQKIESSKTHCAMKPHND